MHKNLEFQDYIPCKTLDHDASLIFEHVIKISPDVANFHSMVCTLAQHSNEHVHCQTLVYQARTSLRGCATVHSVSVGELKHRQSRQFQLILLNDSCFIWMSEKNF
jgi:hypothetical protein